MVTWRNVLPGVLWLAVFTQAARSETYDITEEPRADECFRYLITTTVDGKILAASGDRVQELPLRLTNRIELLQRALEVGDGKVAKSAAVYLDARSDVDLRGERFSKSLRPERRLIVSQRLGGEVLQFSPAGPLTREELELTADHFDSLHLTGLLPKGVVEQGSEWKPDPATVQALCSFDGLISQDLTVKLTKVADGVAKLTITGKANGIELGAIVNLAIEATAEYDLLRKRLVKLQWRQIDDRDGGPLSPALKVESITTLRRELLDKEPEGLSDNALVSVPKDAPADLLRQLVHLDGKGRYQFLYDRGWHEVSQTDSHLVLRLLDRGDFVAQATVAAWRDATPGEHITVEEMKELIAAASGWEMTEAIDEGEIPSQEPGRWTYRLTAKGTSFGTEVVQNVFAVAGPNGDQVVVTFIMKPGNAAKVGTRDLALVQSIQFGGEE